MAEAELRAKALRSLVNALNAASSDSAATLREVSFEAMINLRGNAGDPEFMKVAKQVAGITLPKTPNTTASLNSFRTLWLGPDEWLVVGGDGEQESLIQQLEEAFHGQHVSLVDVSAHRTILQLSGPKARDVLEKGCLLDLHPRAFGSGQCVGTVISKTQVYLEQTNDGPTYRLYVVRSFARHLASWLMDAMAEYTCVLPP